MLRVIQFLWVLPATILTWLFYILPMWLIFRDIVFVRWAEFLVAEFKLAKEDLEPWYAKLWRDWGGWGGPCVFIRRTDGSQLVGQLSLALDHLSALLHALGSRTSLLTDVTDEGRLSRLRKHELEHVHQQFRWGVFFYPAYLIASVWIWLFGGKDTHSYYDNPFEVAARKAALQQIRIGPEQWRDGPDDRWTWW